MITGAVPGAFIKIYKSNGDHTNTWIAGNDGTITYDGMFQAGTYYVTQLVNGIESPSSSTVTFVY